MPVTASRLFDFLEQRPSCSIERYEIASAAFGDLRRSLRSMIVSLTESGEWDATEISNRLRSVLSEWLTVPVSFDNSVLLELKEMGEPATVEARWGRDIRRHHEDACSTARELLELENPVRSILAKLIQTLQVKGQSFRIFCHRRSREHFEALCVAHGIGTLSKKVFIHSVAEYREAEPFDVLMKVGPLRSRGWSSAPDALLTAPRFDTLLQVVWSGCADESGFGYDPVSSSRSEGDTAHETDAITDRYTRSLNLNWKVVETHSRDNTIGRHNVPDINEFEVFARLNQRADLQRATLVQLDEDHGILYPPHSRVLGLDTMTHSVSYRLPGETLLEDMFLILPVVKDARLAGLQAEDGNFSAIWKEKLNAEYRRDPVTLTNRLWDAGLHLLNLQGRIEHWCKPPSTVIHAPQIMQHFEILIKELGLRFDSNESAQNRRAAWWQFAWDEIRRARGEAIQTGFQEQQIVDEEVLAALRAVDADIQANIGQRTFQLAFPPSQTTLRGVFKFYKVLAVEEGFHAPLRELRTLCELRRIDQWRV